MEGEVIITSKTMKVGIYLRLSREDENKDKNFESNSIDNQRQFIMDYIRKNGYYFVDEYSDDGVSGTTFERKNFERMIEDAKSGKINTIITKDLSRFGRNFIEIQNYVDNILPIYNIRFMLEILVIK